MRPEPAGREHRSPGRGRCGAALACVFLMLWPMLWGHGKLAWGQRPSQDEVEAAYLYNFGKFVRWPEAGRGPLRICVAGQESFEKTMSRLVTGEQIGNRPLEVRMVDRPEMAGTCSILYVDGIDRERLDALLAATAGKPVLTVGETPDFLERGGMIQFVPVENHVRFSVNLNAANRCGVGLSSELLKVAVSVTGKPEGRGEENPGAREEPR